VAAFEADHAFLAPAVLARDDERVNVWPALGGSLLLLVGCRQPNPEWEGPADGTDTSDPMTTGPMDPTSVDSSEPEPETEGQSCNNDNFCPDGWVCGPDGCQQGLEGDPCSSEGDCQAPMTVCGPEDACQAGAAGDPCSSDAHCQDPAPLCGPQDTCQDGAAGSPCDTAGDCQPGLMCTDMVCA
jgi:hypothetical protein